MTKPIEIYFWPTPNGHKITIALEEMRLPYVLKPVNLRKGEQFAPDFLKISPNNKMPAAVDPVGPDGKPISIFESGAILQYLGRKSGKFYPRKERGRVAVDQWLFWQVSGFAPSVGQWDHYVNDAPKVVADAGQLAYAQQRFTKEVERLYGVMERRLGEAEFLAGDYSIADMATWPWTRGSFKQDLTRYPNVKTWFERIEARPAVQRALAIGAAARERALAAQPPPGPEQKARTQFGLQLKRPKTSVEQG